MIKTHQIKVGDMTCVMLLDARIRHSIDTMIGMYKQATPEVITEIFGDVTEVPVDINVLYIDTGSTKILADGGFGVVANQPDSGYINSALASIGVSPKEIDIVFFTHLHVDHVLGLATTDGNPAYPNARYLMTQEEWDEWMPRWEVSDDAWEKQQLALIKQLEDKISFVRDGDEVAEGVTVVMMEGHTMGQAGLLVESKGERLFHVADLMHNALQFTYDDWHLGVDSDGDLAVKSRRRILQRCADEQLLSTFCHLEFPGVGYVLQDGEGWKWQPLVL